MREELVSFETAKLARSKGFNEWCMRGWELTADGWQPMKEYGSEEAFEMLHAAYLRIKADPDGVERIRKQLSVSAVLNSSLPDEVFSRPTQDLLERWLRDTYRIGIMIDQLPGLQVFNPIVLWEEKGDRWHDSAFTYQSHEAAREMALLYALNLLP